MSEIIDIIDENNNVIGQGEKSAVRASGKLFRSIHIYIFNSEGKMLVQQRSENYSYPNLVDAGAGGHVSSGENYDLGAKRELKEELGVDAEPEDTGVKFIGSVSGAMGRIYTLQYDGPFLLQESELAGVHWLSIDDIKLLINKYPYLVQKAFINSFAAYLKSLDS